MPETEQRTGCLTLILHLAGIRLEEVKPSKQREPLPYRTRDDFLSPAELSFFHVLMSLIWKKAVICPKVRLADVFFVARPDRNLRYYNRIIQKHIDFLVCEPRTMRPVVGIELDDRSHKRADRQRRDRFVEEVFKAAGLPLVRISVQQSYTRSELLEVLSPYLSDLDEGNAQAKLTTPPSGAKKDTAPICPKCGVPMVLRTATRGKNRGQQFYGCPNYPRCREIRPVE